MQPSIGFDSPALKQAHQAEQDARHAAIVQALAAHGYVVVRVDKQPRTIVHRGNA